MQTRTREKYEASFHGIIANAELVARNLRREPRLEDIITAFGVRISYLQKPSTGYMLSTIRYCIKALIEHKQTGAPLTIYDLPEWVMEGSISDLTKVDEFLRKTPLEITDASQKICEEFYAAAVDQGYQGGQEELIWSFGSKSEKQVSRKTEKPVSYQEVLMIDMALSDESIEGAVDSTTPSRWLRTKGLTRIFALSIWATGMRPVEVWDCRLMIPIPEKMDTAEKRELALKAPREAITQKLYMLVESVKRAPGESIGSVITNITKAAGAPPILIIRSAKQTNANKDLKSEYRVQVLKDTPGVFLSMLGAASQLRHHKISEKRKERVRDKINVVLQNIVREDPSFDRETLSLYSLRHSFATRVKMKFDIATAASLVGHTSKRTTYGYGEIRRTRGASGRGAAQDQATWTPQPDPVHAELISKAWGLSADLDPTQEAAPET